MLPCHSLRGECGLKFLKADGSVLKAWSLSARRVWIEISSVRNITTVRPPSLSARRVWIEIKSFCFALISHAVTLCEESVDWNCVKSNVIHVLFSHSLRGECGLKLSMTSLMRWKTQVTLCEESVDWNSKFIKHSDFSFRHSLRGECGLK